eukprot:m.206796 g.206796  ORF g.206796 m.206796 type:complete len:456 (+) comp32969_c0_seq1:40-1407(+)
MSISMFVNMASILQLVLVCSAFGSSLCVLAVDLPKHNEACTSGFGCAMLNLSVGTVRGNVWSEGEEFLMIPYASAKRFEPPIPVLQFNNSFFDATNIDPYGKAACMQPPYVSGADTYGVEECLIVNIYRPHTNNNNNNDESGKDDNNDDDSNHDSDSDHDDTKDRTLVAVKTLKDLTGLSVSEQATQEASFLREVSLMKGLRHPHLLSLIGVHQQTRPYMMVLEFLPGGSLDTWIAKNRTHMTTQHCQRVLLGIARGMAMLASRAIVHRDLATRNVLVGANAHVKVADFGLSRRLDYDQDYYTMKSGGLVPLRWTAPECVTHFRWTSQSDVYAFGVVISELFSCREPFPSLTDDELLRAIAIPTTALDDHLCFAFESRQAPLTLRTLATDCLHRDPALRPQFGDIVETLITTSVLSLPSSNLNATDSSNQQRTQQKNSNTPQLTFADYLEVETVF